MTEASPHAPSAIQPPPLRLSRLLHAMPPIVFKAWTSAEHVKQWFCPEGSTISEATVEPHVGGVFAYQMQTPDGMTHRVAGTIAELDAPRRLVIAMDGLADDGSTLFKALTELDFTLEPGGTRLDVNQTYAVFDPAMVGPATAGGPVGWGTTLDKLERLVAAMNAEMPAARSVVHAMFQLSRTYDAPVARVWRALTDEAAKAKWFGGPPDRMTLLERHMDVRVGGTERARGRWEGGMVSCFDAIYHDVIDKERLVYSYVMHLDDRKISVSLATMELRVEGGKTTLKVTEQGAFLDGFDDAGGREHGTGYLLDRLGESLKD